MTSNFDASFSSRTYTPTPFSRHYRTRIHDTALSFRFFHRCYLLFCSFPYFRLARLFHAYLRGTYLPGLSGNLTLAPSPERSPYHFDLHPPTHSHPRSKLSLTLSDLRMHIHRHVDTDKHTFVTLFTHSWLTVENFVLSSLSFTLVTSHVDADIFINYVMFGFCFKRIATKFYITKYKIFYFVIFQEKRIM